MRIQVPTLDKQIFETLMKSIYLKPKLATLREILANAIDANIDAQSSRNVILNISSKTISFRDFGNSMTEEVMEDLYRNLFQTTKKDQEESDGEHGIGSKTPYGLLYDMDIPRSQKTFSLRTFINGEETFYIMYFDDHDIPSFDKMYVIPTSEPNGTEVIIPNVYTNEDVRDCFYRVLTPIRHKVDLVGSSKLVSMIKRLLDDNLVINEHFMYAPHINDSTSSYVRPTYTQWIKYKNILYPITFEDIVGTSLYRCFNTNGFIANGQFIINIDPKNDITEPLKVNRSRDRFDEVSEENIFNIVESKVEKLNTLITQLQRQYEEKLDKTFGSYAYSEAKHIKADLSQCKSRYIQPYSNMTDSERLESIKNKLVKHFKDENFDDFITSLINESPFYDDFLTIINNVAYDYSIFSSLYDEISRTDCYNKFASTIDSLITDKKLKEFDFTKAYDGVAENWVYKFQYVKKDRVTNPVECLESCYILVKDIKGFKPYAIEFAKDKVSKISLGEDIHFYILDKNDTRLYDEEINPNFHNIIKISDLVDVYTPSNIEKGASSTTNKRISGLEEVYTESKPTGHISARMCGRKTIDSDLFMNLTEAESAIAYYYDPVTMGDKTYTFETNDNVQVEVTLSNCGLTFNVNGVEKLQSHLFSFRNLIYLVNTKSNQDNEIYNKRKSFFVMDREMKDKDRKLILNNCHSVIELIQYAISLLNLKVTYDVFHKYAIECYYKDQTDKLKVDDDTFCKYKNRENMLSNMLIKFIQKNSKNDYIEEKLQSKAEVESNYFVTNFKIEQNSVDNTQILDIIDKKLDEDEFWDAVLLTTLSGRISMHFLDSPNSKRVMTIVQRFIEEISLNNRLNVLTNDE